MIADISRDFDFDTARQRIFDLPEVNAAARNEKVPNSLLDDIINLLVVEDADIYDGKIERAENENEIIEVEQQHKMSLFQNFGISLVFVIVGIAIQVSPIATAFFIAIALYFLVTGIQQIRYFAKYRTAIINHDRLIGLVATTPPKIGQLLEQV